jgi:hypothetical protein
MYEIEKDIPVTIKSEKAKYPFSEMEVGDSFLVPKGQENAKLHREAAYSHGRKNNVKFKTKSVAGGTRIWRIA